MSKISDSELMLLADGEADDPRDLDAASSQKMDAIREVGDLVRGHLELAADDADARLGALWTLVERRLDTAEGAPAPERARPIPAAGLWSRFIRWVDGHRSHLLTGALSAGAVAAVALVIRTTTPAPRPEVKVITKTVQVPVTGPTEVKPAMLQATEPEVESLEVSNGTPTVFTIPDDDGGADTAVIYIDQDDVVEGI